MSTDGMSSWLNLKAILALAFSVTTPVGIAAGLGVFGPGRSDGGAYSVPVAFAILNIDD